MPEREEIKALSEDRIPNRRIVSFENEKAYNIRIIETPFVGTGVFFLVGFY
jgi:hypothetical protein